MRLCNQADFNLISDLILGVSRKKDADMSGYFSKDSSGTLMFTLSSRTLPVFPHRDDFLEIEGGGEIPLEKMLNVVANSISKPKWEVYAVYDPQTKRYYYNQRNRFLESSVEGEPWQRPEGT